MILSFAAHMARVRLRDRHQENLKKKLELLKAEQKVEEEPTEAPEYNLIEPKEESKEEAPESRYLYIYLFILYKKLILYILKKGYFPYDISFNVEKVVLLIMHFSCISVLKTVFCMNFLRQHLIKWLTFSS